MSEHDEARRKFLLGAAGAGAVAGATLVPDAVAQAQSPSAASSPGPSTVAKQGHGAFLNDDNAAAIDAMAERIFPAGPGMAGAREAGVLNYIDLALAGAYADQQDFYRRGLSQLEAYCQSAYKDSFAALKPEQQDEILTALEGDKATGFAWPSAKNFFERVRVHTIEGMFADPLYGGNKDFAGWKLVGFPGAQPLYTTEDMNSTQAFDRVPTQGLQLQAKNNVRR